MKVIGEVFFMRKRADHFNRFLFCFGIVPLDQIGGE